MDEKNMKNFIPHYIHIAQHDIFNIIKLFSEIHNLFPRASCLYFLWVGEEALVLASWKYPDSRYF